MKHNDTTTTTTRDTRAIDERNAREYSHAIDRDAMRARAQRVNDEQRANNARDNARIDALFDIARENMMRDDDDDDNARATRVRDIMRRLTRARR